MRPLIEALCSRECAGRRPGTPGGERARALVLEALRGAGLDPHEQAVPGCGGANVLARIRGDLDRHIVVGAHFDHLGEYGDQVFHGADDNAGAVGVLVEVAREVANEHDGRGVIIAAFDGEEPPHFLGDGMGSREFVRTNRDPIDFMICMDLVGHRVGPGTAPDEVGHSLFALGAERSLGTVELVSSLKRSEPGVIVRPADAEIVPPMSDYEAFWQQRIPFLFLTAGRSRDYHTPRDTPDKLDYRKLAATVRWLTGLVRRTRRRDPIAFVEAPLDLGTLEELREVIAALGATPEGNEVAAMALAHVDGLRAECDRHGNLPLSRRGEVPLLVSMIESYLG